MVKVRLLSDLHLDMRDGLEALNKLPEVEADVVVVAGDVSNSKKLAPCLQLICTRFSSLPVIMVDGNHHFWGTKPRKEVLEDIKHIQDCNSNLIHLDCSSVEIKGKRFHGAPLWFSKPRPELAWSWSDIHMIPSREWIYEENKKAFDFFNTNLKEGDIAISHHLPSYKAVNEKYQGDVFNHFFVYPMDDVIKRTKPAVWMFGHIHMACDIMVYNTRLVLNPLGYPNGEEGNNGFRNDLVVEV